MALDYWLPIKVFLYCRGESRYRIKFNWKPEIVCLEIATFLKHSTDKLRLSPVAIKDQRRGLWPKNPIAESNR